ncbi:MAG TPA: NAD(P)/FAD-dependent oxidoreductase [Candidatus Kapabacteria bacterium]|nr:NAD(P)/FAD-dependent oxidoreductase [Candidatus Kapabacteria bacterium]
MSYPRIAKNPILRMLQRVFAQSANASGAEHPARRSENGVSRRTFIKGAALSAAAAAFPLPVAAAASSKKVVIIGAGLAGLNAAYTLQKAGVATEIYEGSPRSGGRIFSVTDAMGPGLVAEYGGEFIDAKHADLLGLASEFGLKVLDRRALADPKLVRQAFFFDGKFYSEKEIVDAFSPAIERIAKDSAVLQHNPTYDHHSTNATTFDKMPLSQYLSSLGFEDWLYKLLRAAYVTEFGLEIEEQSTLNFLSMFPRVNTDSTLELYGDGAERYKISGGNEQVTKALSKKLDGHIHLSHKLISIRSDGRGFAMTFKIGDDKFVDVKADMLVLAIPFSVLRHIDTKVELPKWKKNAIMELGYGTNAKVMLGFSKRLWNEKGYSGEVFSNENYQLIWDNTEFQQGDSGGLTIFLGGHAGVQSESGMADEQANYFAPALEKTFPGITAVRNFYDKRMHWPSYPFSLGSYSVYKKGQWTTIRGAEFKPVGNLFFAGEHCSLEFQGYMNGAAETGRRAAVEILKAMV